MPKISALPPAGTLADDDETPFVDDSVAATKKFTLAGLKTWLQTLTAWISNLALDSSAITLVAPSVLESNITSITTEKDSGLTLTVNIPAGWTRYIQLEAVFPSAQSGAQYDQLGVRIKEGSTTLAAMSSGNARQTSGQISGLVVKTKPFIPTPGAHTYKVTVFRYSGSGTLTAQASATEPIYLTAMAV